MIRFHKPFEYRVSRKKNEKERGVEMYEVVGISRFKAKKTETNWCVISALKNHYEITDGYQAKEFWIKQDNPISEVFEEFGRYEIFFDETGKYMQAATYVGPSEIFDIVDIDYGSKK